MNIRTTFCHPLFGILALIFLCSCSSKESVDPDGESDAKEIKAKAKTSLDLPELELFSNARRQYQSGLYSIARESFDAIKDNYPTGPYAEFSELKVADTLFQNSDYPTAALAYDNFTKNRPASSALPYAFLRAGRSFELSSAGIGRDPTPLNKAIEQYTSLIERFPNSVYASSARYYRKGVEELLATYEKQVIDFYDKKNKTHASSARDSEFVKRFGTSSNEFEPGSYDKRVALAVGPISEDKVVAAKIALESLPSVSDSGGQAFRGESLSQLPPDGKVIVTSVSCDPNEKLVMLTLEPMPQAAITNLDAYKKGDSIELNIGELTTIGEETKTYTCFSEGDLTISSSGLLTLRAPQALGATAMFVDNPARVLITLS